MNKRQEIIIKDAKVEIAGNIMQESVFTVLKLQKDKKITYYTLYEYGGMAVEFYKSKEDLYDYFMDESELDDDQIDFVKSKLIYSIGDVSLEDSNNWYDQIFESLNDSKDEESKRIVKLLIAFTRLDWGEIKMLKEKSIGKNLFDIEIPLSDAEKEYLGLDDEDE